MDIFAKIFMGFIVVVNIACGIVRIFKHDTETGILDIMFGAMIALCLSIRNFW